MEIPETRYARVDDLRIAYQEWGRGPRTLIIPPLVSNIDVQWDHEVYRRMLEHLGTYLRVIHFDKRGIGLSDRFDEVPTLEERSRDIEGVLDAAGWDRANVIGISEGAAMAQVFAVRHPERVEKLVLTGGGPPVKYRERAKELAGDAWRSLEDRAADFDEVMENWGESADAFVRLMAPSQAENPAYVRWINRLNRNSASPADFRRQLESLTGLTAEMEPDKITQPTLVVHLTGDRVAPIGHGRALAELIPGARLVEVDGQDHFLVTLPNWREGIDPMIEFITGERPALAIERRFGTVLFTDIIDSTALASSFGDSTWRELIDEHDRIVHRITGEFGGRVVKSTGDGVMAVFDTPSAGVQATQRIRDDLRPLDLSIRAGLHAGEIELHADLDISGLAVNLAARVESEAPEGCIWVSSTVRDMLLGSGIELTDQGEHDLKGIDGRWRLYEVS